MICVKSVKMFQFKAKDSEIKPYPLCLGNISKDFAIDNIKKNRIKRKCTSFSVDHNVVDTKDVSDIYASLIEEA